MLRPAEEAEIHAHAIEALGRIAPLVTPVQLAALETLTGIHINSTRKGHDMPKIGQMLPSKFLKKEDLDGPTLATVAGVQQQDVGTQDAPDTKWTMTFEELEKPLVLNSTNIQLAAQALGSDDTDDWIGQKLVLYVDPNVSYAGKIVGGIRIRAPKKQAQAPARKPVSAGGGMVDMEDDVPFAPYARGISGHAL